MHWETQKLIWLTLLVATFLYCGHLDRTCTFLYTQPLSRHPGGHTPHSRVSAPTQASNPNPPPAQHCPRRSQGPASSLPRRAGRSSYPLPTQRLAGTCLKSPVSRRWSTAWLGVHPCPVQRPRTAQARPEGGHPPRGPVRASFSSAQASAPRRAAQPGTNPRPLDCSSPASAYTPLNRVRPTTDSTATGQRRGHRTLGPCPSTHQPRVRSRPGNGSRPRLSRACACPSAEVQERSFPAALGPAPWPESAGSGGARSPASPRFPSRMVAVKKNVRF